MQIILISLMAGIVTGLGMGGGTILILLLVTFMNIEQHIAQSTNLIFFIPTAIMASITNHKENLIEYKLSCKMIITGVVSAIIGAYFCNKIDSQNLKKYFGFFLLLIGIYEIFSIIYEYMKKNKTNNNIVN